jgi:RNA polymerase sigma-70 factor (sigma-E family)
MDSETERDFTAFVNARGHALFRTAMALTGHHQQARDLLQTVLANAFRRWPQIRHDRPEAYLRQAMYRQRVSWWRRPAGRLEVTTDNPPEAMAADPTEQVNLRLALLPALDRLAPKHRAVLVLRYLEDLPDDELSRILGCKPATVRSQIARALGRLRLLCPELDTFAVQEARR